MSVCEGNDYHIETHFAVRVPATVLDIVLKLTTEILACFLAAAVVVVTADCCASLVCCSVASASSVAAPYLLCCSCRKWRQQRERRKGEDSGKADCEGSSFKLQQCRDGHLFVTEGKESCHELFGAGRKCVCVCKESAIAERLSV